LTIVRAIGYGYWLLLMAIGYGYPLFGFATNYCYGYWLLSIAIGYFEVQFLELALLKVKY
jgi:hypothetical protein